MLLVDHAVAEVLTLAPSTSSGSSSTDGDAGNTLTFPPFAGATKKPTKAPTTPAVTTATSTPATTTTAPPTTSPTPSETPTTPVPSPTETTTTAPTPTETTTTAPTPTEATTTPPTPTETTAAPISTAPPSTTPLPTTTAVPAHEEAAEAHVNVTVAVTANVTASANVTLKVNANATANANATTNLNETVLGVPVAEKKNTTQVAGSGSDEGETVGKITQVAKPFTPYRSDYMRCQPNECQVDILGDSSKGCVQMNEDGTCPTGYKQGVSTNSYKVDIVPSAPSTVMDVTFSMLASDVAGALYNLGDNNPMERNKTWWIAFELPDKWRFVDWNITSVVVKRSDANGGNQVSRQFTLQSCSSVADASSCHGSNAGLIDVHDMLLDWQALVAQPSNLPMSFELRKSVISGPQTSNQAGINVFIVYKKSEQSTGTTRVLSVDVAMANDPTSSAMGGSLAVIPLATMAIPTITQGKLDSSLVWVEANRNRATLSFSTTTLVSRTSVNPKVCADLRSSTCSARGRISMSNVTFNSDRNAAFVKDGNPFVGMFADPGDSNLTVKPVNSTYFCVENLLPTGAQANASWEAASKFTFQLVVYGLQWAGTEENNKTDHFALPYLTEITLWDQDLVQGSDCAQLLVHQDVASSSHSLSIYSVMSITIYVVGLVGSVLVTRMNGVTFSSATFYNDMTSVSVLVIFVLSIISYALWITVSSKSRTVNGSHVFFLFQMIIYCFEWTMMTSVCFHWTTVLHRDIRRLKHMYVKFVFAVVNLAFYTFGVFALLALSDFFHCTYDDYLKNPNYSKRLCGSDYCPDLQPTQWKYASNDLCKDISHSSLFFPVMLGFRLFVFLAALTLLLLGVGVLKRGSKLIESSGDIVDARVVAVMRKSLRTYLTVIIAITMALGVSFIMSVVLYMTNASVNVVVWYLFAVWFPTLIPPIGFLILQWNPRLHGIRLSREQTLKPDADADNSKSMMRDSTMLSDGWAGASIFATTDYQPVTLGTDEGNSNVLALSLQLKSSQPIPQACYVELYEADVENDVSGEDFDPAEQSRASVSAVLETGLHRESLMQLRSSMINSLHGTVMGSQWVRVGFTETVMPLVKTAQDDTTCYVAPFMSVLQIPVPSSFSLMRFVVYSIPEAESVPEVEEPSEDEQNLRRGREASISGMSRFPPTKPRVLCEFTCSSSDLLQTDELCLPATQVALRLRPSHLDLTSLETESSVPQLRVLTATATTRVLKNNKSFLATSTFELGDGADMLIEDMTESVFTNEVPRQFIDLLLKERHHDVTQAENELKAFEEKCKRGLVAGMFDNLIEQIQGENVQAVVQGWLQERIRLRSAYEDDLRECQRVCVSRAEDGVYFKSSTQKKESLLRFLPINMHVQDMWVGPRNDMRSQLTRRTSNKVRVYSTLTVGAFAAHNFKFRHGMGAISLRERLIKRPSSSLMHSDSALSDVSSSGDDIDWTEEATRHEDELKWHLVTRMDMCLSQALTSVVTSFCRNLEMALQQPSYRNFLNVLDGVGFLWQIESLLSTQGKENGMLEDFFAASEAMKNVSFVLDTSPPSHLPPTLNLHLKELDLPSVVSVRLSGEVRSSVYTVVVGVRCSGEVLEAIPDRLRNGGKISVTSVMFTQGINEMQTLANGTPSKKTSLQHTINQGSYTILASYVDKYAKFISAGEYEAPADVTMIRNRLKRLEEIITSVGKEMMKFKHPEIIQESSRLCRMLGAGRVTSCKSAKDRTGMAVTLEQGRLLCDYHQLPSEYLMRTISTMRSNGVRLENVFKNTGKRQYAFNALQRSLLPDEYKCPEGTYGRGNVS